MIKMLVIDLDNTLLRSDKTISDYSARILNQSHTNKLKVVFATARPIRTVKEFLKDIPCDAVIYHNGAFTLSGTSQIGNAYRVPISEARRILETIGHENSARKLSVEINDTLYANFNVKEFWSYTNAIKSDFTDLPNVDADKILVEVRTQNEYDDTLRMLTPEIYGQMSDGKLCLIMNRNATKLNAVKQLSKHWNIAMTEIASFGDDYNDIEMIQNCGIGVAMGNAIDEVKQIADVVADVNDSDGVAKYIEEYVLLHYVV